MEAIPLGVYIYMLLPRSGVIGEWRGEGPSRLEGRGIPPSYWLAFRSTHKLAKAIAKASYDDPAGQISRYLIPGVITES